MAWFALFDCNDFYTSCEGIFDPSARHFPMVVLSSNDGNVISRNKAAKDLGIKMGAPTFTLRQLIAEHKIKVYSSNYTLYGDMSARVMNSLAELCPRVEVYSIDESFVLLSIFHVHELVPFARNVRYLVKKWTKIPVSVGIANTKTLAKVANKVAKKNPEYDGVFAITDEAQRREVLSRFDIADVWGIGRQHLKRMHVEGVKTALHLADKPDWWVKGHFSIVGQRLVRELRGESCIGMLDPRERSKNICCSRSFGVHLNSIEQIREAVSTFAGRVGEKLREQQASARVLTVFIDTNRFREDLAQYNNSVSIPLPVATSSSAELIQYALAGLQDIYKTGYLYKKAGVLVTGIVPTDQVQTSMFNAADREKLSRAAAVMDKLNAKFGRNTVTYAVQGNDKAFWHPKHENLTPRYTTRWGDLPKVELG